MGGNISVASASMADLSSEKDRAKSMGMIGAGIGLGFIFGPPLGGFLSKVELSFLKGDYLAPYAPAALVSLLIAFINLLLILFYLKESLPQFEKVETHSSKPIHPILGLKKTHLSELPLFCLIFFLYTFAFSGFEFSFNFFLSIVFSLTPSEIGGVFVYLGLLIILVQGGLIRRVSGKISEKKLCLLGGLLLCFGFTLLYFSNTIGFTLFSLFFTAVGSGILNPSLSSLTSLHSSPEEQGTNLGIFRSFGSLARAFAPILYGFLYFNTSHQMVFLSSGVLLFLTLLLVFKIKD
jgi:MFS family permease